MDLPPPKNRQLASVETPLLDLDPEQVERHKDSPEHAALKENIRLHGILEPLTGKKRANGRYAVLSGNGRGSAAVDLGLDTVPMLLLADDDTNEAVCVLVANLLRKDLTPGQLLKGVEGIHASEPDWLSKDIAHQTGIAEGRVSQLFAIGACPAARTELVEGRMSVNEAYAVTRAATPEAKAGLIAMKAAGASSHEITARARKPRTAIETVKVSSIRTLLPSGVSIVARGEGLSLEDLADALADARKEVLRAVSDGLNAKTYSAVVAQKSRKAGGA